MAARDGPWLAVGQAEDLDRIEENGYASDARPEFVSHEAKKRQAREMGTLGSGNHYLEVLRIAQIYDAATATRVWAAAG